ncbi:hypothetical protein [Rheinheimera sp. SA_1]|nr:hypothetical protein [Rheinheimera sp. SA_1]
MNFRKIALLALCLVSAAAFAETCTGCYRVTGGWICESCKGG